MNKAEEKPNKRLEELNELMKKEINILSEWLSLREVRTIKEIQEEIDYIHATL